MQFAQKCVGVDGPARRPAYTPPVHANHLDARYLYYYGYSLNQCPG